MGAWTLSAPLPPEAQELLRKLIGNAQQRVLEKIATEFWTRPPIVNIPWRHGKSRHVWWAEQYLNPTEWTMKQPTQWRKATEGELAEALKDIDQRAKLVMQQNVHEGLEALVLSDQALAVRKARYRLAKSTRDYLASNFQIYQGMLDKYPLVLVKDEGSIDRAVNPIWRDATGPEMRMHADKLVWRVKWDPKLAGGAGGIAVDEVVTDAPIAKAPFNGVAKVKFADTSTPHYRYSYRTNLGPEIVGRPAIVMVAGRAVLVEITGWEPYEKAAKKPHKWLWAVPGRDQNGHRELELATKPAEVEALEAQLKLARQKRDKAQEEARAASKQAEEAAEEVRALARKVDDQRARASRSEV